LAHCASTTGIKNKLPCLVLEDIRHRIAHPGPVTGSAGLKPIDGLQQIWRRGGGTEALHL
jgi:hypothetical protein